MADSLTDRNAIKSGSGDAVEPELKIHQRILSEEDRRILEAIEPIVSGLASFLGKHCEVLLHTLEDLSRSITYIENGQVTGRESGAPITDLALQVLRKVEDNVEPDGTIGQDHLIYMARTTDGRPLRSITIVIRNHDRPIGMLCLNYDLSVPLHEVIDLMNTFSTSNDNDQDSPEHYMMSADELVARSIDVAISKVTPMRGLSPQHRNRMIVNDLNQQGIFDIKGSVDMISNELGVSRFTIYNYLRSLREEENNDEQDND